MSRALASVADSAVRLADVCVVGQWRLAMRDTCAARVTRSACCARVERRAFPVPVGASPTTCAELLDVSLAIAERGRGGARSSRAFGFVNAERPGGGRRDALCESSSSRDTIARSAIPARARRAAAPLVHARLAAIRETGLQLQIDLATELGDTAVGATSRERLLSTSR